MAEQIQISFDSFISSDDLPESAEISICSLCGQAYLSESGERQDDWYCPCCE